jgi:hypothetical protein
MIVTVYFCGVRLEFRGNEAAGCYRIKLAASVVCIAQLLSAFVQELY